MFLVLFGENIIFDYLTLKLTFWHWRWPQIMKVIQEMYILVKVLHVYDFAY